MDNYRLRPTGHLEPVRNAEYQMATQLEGAQETLAKSRLYFAAADLAQMAPAPDLWAMLDRTDTVIRSAICHAESYAQYEGRQVALTEGLGEIQALTGAARATAQLFRVLCNDGMQASGLAPLRRLADAVIRQLRATASALDHQDAEMARTATRAYFETRGIASDVSDLLPALAIFLPETTVRMIRAAAIALMVTARATARIAHRFSEAVTLVEKARVTRVPYAWDDSVQNDLLPLPTLEIP
jgi:hypothetical protein